MNVLLNHIWCQDSIWGGEYDCRCAVSIHMVQAGKSYHDPHDPVTKKFKRVPRWVNCP